MKSSPEQFNSLSKEELVQMCAELQDKVTRTITLKQDLIGIKNDLDEELNRFRVIEEFGRQKAVRGAHREALNQSHR